MRSASRERERDDREIAKVKMEGEEDEGKGSGTAPRSAASTPEVGEDFSDSAHGTEVVERQITINPSLSFLRRLGSCASMPSTSRSMRRLDSMEVEASKVAGMGSGQKILSMGLILQLAFQSIGVVYGDLATSPLYVFSSTFSNLGTLTKNDVLGSISLIIYTLTLIPLIKYCFIVLQANDNGDGGTFALYSLICRHAKVSVLPNQNSEDQNVSSYKLVLPSRQFKISLKIKEALEKSRFYQNVLLYVALLSTCMVISDGVLTPAISVLSAVEGIKVKAIKLENNIVVIISVVILVGLFSIQYFGTGKVGFLFAPIVLLWLALIGGVGIYNIIKHDIGVLKAFNPYYILKFFRRHKQAGWVSLGGIVLCITGTEAMFADLGHFSVRSIQIAFASAVYPCLMLAYLGQASYLMKHPRDVGQTFYKSLPKAVYWPVFVTAVLAAIVASQAMISATFSIVKQSMALGCFPRVKVVHTSAKHIGQVFIPELNLFLMLGCIAVTVGFKDTTKLGNAYGICVVAVMVVTTTLLTLIMLLIWQTNILLAAAFLVVFGVVELIYFSSVLFKFVQGGWLPLAFAAFLLFIMAVWHYVSVKKYQYELQNKVPIDWILALGSTLGMVRVPGVGLVYTELSKGVPCIFSHFITSLPAMHSIVVFVCIKYLPVSTVPAAERFVFRRVGPKDYHIYRCIARYGYKEVRHEHDDFEDMLMLSLENFIQFEHQSVSHQQSETDSSSEHDGDGSSMRVYPAKVMQPSGRTGIEKNLSKQRSVDLEVQEELIFAERMKQTGVVYLLGQIHVKAKRDSSFVKRFIVDYAYAFIKINTRRSPIILNVPHTRLLEVGMVYHI
ncbi:hypothetical protein O6H91_08G084600 [Diphasiastrum complanatum]|uniref:Uncharacterized protein n=1 Tax=Diphasiastrum complanatum TaxID=34168 RepID=A0ACC2CZE6_DIPCM|nr:hypothetical protein O6H91_08G084600 [Diphasiastrum complanatum]